MRVNCPLNDSVILISLNSKASRITLFDRKHLYVMNTVAMTRPRRRPWRKWKVLVFWNVGSDVRAKGYGKVTTLSAKAQPHNNDARPAMFDHELSISTTAQFDKLVRYGNDVQAYRTKSVSGPIIHSFRNGYLVLWWSSSHTRPSPHFSGREASSALMPYRSLSRSTSASVGISRSVSAIVFGHSTCR